MSIPFLNWTLRLGLGLLLVLPIPSALGQEPQATTTTSYDTLPAPGEDRDCSYTAASRNNCNNAVRVTIGLRLNLGAAEKAMWDMVWANPLARVGWPAEFEISRDSADGNQLVLIDMRKMPGRTASDEDSISYNAAEYEVAELDHEMPSIPIGALGDPDLAGKFNSVLRSIIRLRALSMLADRSGQSDLAWCIEPVGQDCPANGDSDLSTLTSHDEVQIGVRNMLREDSASVGSFAYVLMVTPTGEATVVIAPEDNGGKTFDSGQLVVNQAETFKLSRGRYRFFTLFRKEPFDPAFIQRHPVSGRRLINCRSGLEAKLCSALSGMNIASPSFTEMDAMGFKMTEHSLFFDPKTVVRVGGGQMAPRGFAPWQAQIFSNQTYSRQQIEADRALGNKGKGWALQKPFQRYHRCGGSLIAPGIVLTAAHCVAKGPTAGTEVLRVREVRLGTQDLTKPGAIYRIAAVVVHRGYLPTGQHDDIAVLRIVPKQGVAPQVPVALPHQVSGFPRIGPGAPISVLGWGMMGEVKRGERHEWTEDGPQSAVAQLQIGALEAFDLGKCQRIPGYGDIHKTICAVSRRGNAERAFSCRGDSGGPVISQRNGRVVQVGLVSGGVGCGAVENGQQNPSRFVDLAQYGDWIEAAMKRAREIDQTVTRYP